MSFPNYTTVGRMKYTGEKHAAAMLMLREAGRRAHEGNEAGRIHTLELAAHYAHQWADSIEASIRQPPKGKRQAKPLLNIGPAPLGDPNNRETIL